MHRLMLLIRLRDNPPLVVRSRRSFYFIFWKFITESCVVCVRSGLITGSCVVSIKS